MDTQTILPNFQYQDIELGDLKQHLPLGIFLPNGDLLREYSLKVYTGHHDLLLGQLESENKDYSNHINRIYEKFLSVIVESIGGYSVSEVANILPQCSRVRLFGQMYLADVLAILLNVRLAAYDGNIALKGECPCDRKIKISEGTIDCPPHDLRTAMVRIWTSSSAPVFPVTLETGTIELEPPRFNQLQLLSSLEHLPYEVRLLYICASNFDEDVYRNLKRRDRETLKRAVKKVVSFGVERSIDMDCPACGLEWKVPLTIGKDYEQFYANLLSPPCQQGKTVEETLDELAFFLTTGESAPLSSITEVYNLTPARRMFWVEKLSDTYKKQQEELKKSQAKSKARKR